MKLRKIPLDQLLTVLEDLFEKGVDYIDISGTSSPDDEKQDVIKISVRPEYMSKEDEDEENYEEDFIKPPFGEEENSQNPANINFTEDDFDELI